jgi:hypothetical protein
MKRCGTGTNPFVGLYYANSITSNHWYELDVGKTPSFRHRRFLHLFGTIGGGDQSTTSVARYLVPPFAKSRRMSPWHRSGAHQQIRSLPCSSWRSSISVDLRSHCRYFSMTSFLVPSIPMTKGFPHFDGRPTRTLWGVGLSNFLLSTLGATEATGLGWTWGRVGGDRLDVDVLCKGSPFLNKPEPAFRLGPHQVLDRFPRALCVLVV